MLGLAEGRFFAMRMTGLCHLICLCKKMYSYWYLDDILRWYLPFSRNFLVLSHVLNWTSFRFGCFYFTIVWKSKLVSLTHIAGLNFDNFSKSWLCEQRVIFVFIQFMSPPSTGCGTNCLFQCKGCCLVPVRRNSIQQFTLLAVVLMGSSHGRWSELSTNCLA
jgi:hypothetical protein